MTEEWKICGSWLLLLLGVLLLIALGLLWFISLGHISLASKLWEKLEEFDDSIYDRMCQRRIRKEVQKVNKSKTGCSNRQ
jgi:hypothetical protein